MRVNKTHCAIYKFRTIAGESIKAVGAIDTSLNLLRCRGGWSSPSLVRLSVMHLSTAYLVSQISERKLADASWEKVRILSP